MEKARLDYFIFNGRACSQFLEQMAKCGDMLEFNRNTVLNHALAVEHLISELKRYAEENKKLMSRLLAAEDKLERLEKAEINPLVDERMKTLKDILKACVVDAIEDF